MEYIITFTWDEEASVWVATSNDIPGLVLESGSLVEMTENVEIGEIGIFLVNGESYVKERGENELRSLNPNSKNIPLNEDARCLGKVIGKIEE